MTTPLVISYESDPTNQNSCFYKQTLYKNNWECVFIGENEKWNGFQSLIHGYFKILKTIDSDRLIVLTDARDVICCRSPKSFVNTYNSLCKNKIMVSAEMFLNGHMDWSDEQLCIAIQKNPRAFWQGVPLTKYWKYHNIPPPMRKYVNTGLIVGKAADLLDLFEWIIKNNIVDDQLGFAKYTLEFPDRVYIDYEAKVFHTCGAGIVGACYSTEIQLQDSPTILELMGMSSYFLHVPGINASKGQKKVYDVCVHAISKLPTGGKILYELYDDYEQDTYFPSFTITR